MARSGLRLNIQRAAALLDVSVPMLRRLEAGDWGPSITPATIERIQAAYESAGVSFDADDGRGPGVRARD